MVKSYACLLQAGSRVQPTPRLSNLSRLLLTATHSDAKVELQLCTWAGRMPTSKARAPDAPSMTKFTNPVSGIESDDETPEMFDSEQQRTPRRQTNATAFATFDSENAGHTAAVGTRRDQKRDGDSEVRTLWVSNIAPQHFQEKIIKGAFELVGGHGPHDNVVESVVCRAKDLPSKSWCLVKFFDTEHAQLALLGAERLLEDKQIELPEMCRDWTIKPCKSTMLRSDAAQLVEAVLDREVVAESMEHLGSEEMAAFTQVTSVPAYVLCEGLVQCQFDGRKKSPFTSVWLSLKSDGALTLSTISSLPGFSGPPRHTVLNQLSAVWCSVKKPKTKRPQYPNAVRLDIDLGINGKRKKFILDVKDQDAASSGMSLDVLKTHLISCSYAKLSASGLILESEKDRRTRESAKDMSSSGMVLNPESRFRRRWDVMQIMLLLYVAIVVPFRVAFNVTLELWGFWFFFDLLSDLYFISDMFLSFQTAFYDERGELETKTDKIFAHYFRTWFVIDFVACFPGKIIDYMFGDGSDTGLLNLTVLLKLLRLARIARLISRYEAEFHEFLSKIQFGKLVLIMGFIGHWLCCLWFAIGSLHSDDLDQFGDPVQGWVQRTWGTDDSSLSTATTMDRSALIVHITPDAKIHATSDAATISHCCRLDVRGSQISSKLLLGNHDNDYCGVR